MKRQKAGTPKTRFDLRLPADLDTKVQKIATRAGTTRTAVLVAAVERFIYAEDTQAGVETIHERVAALTVGQDRMMWELLEVRAYLDTLAQTICGSQGKFDAFLAAVDKVKSELAEDAG